MNIFVIPSWYPTQDFPSTGIFFKEQSVLLARHKSDYNVGISLWGSHELKLWLKVSQPLTSFTKYFSKPPLKSADRLLEPNCVEFFHPAYTWTRKIKKGNIEGIIRANEQNLKRYTAYFRKPDVIHAHVAYPGGYVAQTLSRKYNIPYVVTEHMSPFPLPSFKMDFDRYVIEPLRKANLVLAVSEALSDRLLHYGIQAAKISNFIDDQFFRPVRVNSNIFTFVVVARLEEQKGIIYLIKAAERLKKDHFEFRIKIIGSGSLRRSLQASAEQANLDIQWLGEGNREFVRDELQSGDAFVLPSLHENQPVAILEALACGLPVLTTDWSGSDEVVSEKTGLIVEMQNVKALADGLRRFLTDLRFSREEIRLEYEKHYSAGQVIGQLEKYYRNLSN